MFDIDAMSLEILNRQPEIRSLPEELEAVKAELRVYQDMQANLNTNLSMYPAFLDAIEDLQCSVYPEDEMPSPYQMATDVYDRYYCDLKDEVKRLHGERDTQERQIGIYDITLQLGLENELRLERRVRDLEQLNRNQVLMLEDYEVKYNLCFGATTALQDYCDNASMWRKAYEDLKQYKEPS